MTWTAGARKAVASLELVIVESICTRYSKVSRPWTVPTAVANDLPIVLHVARRMSCAGLCISLLLRADGTYVDELARMARFDVIVLDDLLSAPTKDSEKRDLLEERYDHKSTVITAQLLAKNVAWNWVFAIAVASDIPLLN